jgi:hypothetical protein
MSTLQVKLDACWKQPRVPYKKLRKPMVNANVISALAHAIEEHTNKEEIQRWAHKTMKQLL